MHKPGPPRPNAKGKELRASLDDEPTAVALPTSAEATTRAPAPDASDLEVTVADPVNDLLATTEMPTVREGFVAPEEQPAQEEEEQDPNKAYFAPQAIPTPAVPDNDDSRRIVLNLPDQGAVLPPSPQDMERARRRAPTVKIPRATLAARGMVPGAAPAAAAPEVALPPPPPPAPRAPVLATPTEDPPEAKPDSPLLSLPVHPRETPSSSERRAEPPPTARHVSDPPQRSRSRMPLVALAALCIGGGVFAVFSLGGGAREATKVTEAGGPAAKAPEKSPAAAPPATTTTAAEKPVAVTPPEETAAPAITLTADPAPPATQTMAGASTPPKPTPPTAAGPSPTAPRPATPGYLPASPAATPRPPTAAPPKPPTKPGDYTPPTI